MYPRVHKMEADLRHKLFPPNAWMKVLHFNVLTSCPKDELHQWFIGLFGEHIILAIDGPSSTATQRFCSDRIWLPWIRTATRISCCQTRRLPGSSSACSQSRSETSRRAAETKRARKLAVDQIWKNIYLVFTCHMYQLSKSCISRVQTVSPALAFICICWC